MRPPRLPLRPSGSRRWPAVDPRWTALPALVALLLGHLAPPAATAMPLSAPGDASPDDSGVRIRRWGDGVRLELLPLWQSSPEPAARSQVDLLIPPGTLTDPFTALQIGFPSPLSKGASLARRLRLCRVPTPLSIRRVPCLEPWPVQVEVQDGGLRIRPLRPLDPAAAYALSALTRNSPREGFHPLRLYGVRADQPEPVYVGTWLLEVVSRAE